MSLKNESIVGSLIKDEWWTYNKFRMVPLVLLVVAGNQHNSTCFSIYFWLSSIVHPCERDRCPMWFCILFEDQVYLVTQRTIYPFVQLITMHLFYQTHHKHYLMKRIFLGKPLFFKLRCSIIFCNITSLQRHAVLPTLFRSN